MKKIVLLLLSMISLSFLFSQATIIGTTTYDVQTNNGSKNHINVYDDGTMSAVWTGSVNDVGGGTLSAFSDRGTFYNHFDGSIWGAAPTARIEDVRTGFVELIRVDDHEVVIGHNIQDGINYKLGFFANDAIGSSSWSELAGSDVVSGVWASSYCPEGTDDIYTICSDNATITQFYFSRSDDGGNSWTVLNQVLPYLTTADGIPSVAGAAESYQIAVHGSDVYVLFGMPTSDLVLLHSDDYGNEGTWEQSDIIDFPFENFDGLVQTDIDGDLVTDTLNTTDGYHEMLIEDDGTLHIFSGLMRLYSDGFGYILNYKSSGIWHWSTGMDSAELLNTELDWSSPDCVYSPFTGIGAYVYNYRNAGVCSNPAASYDPATGRIYLLYTMKLEYTDLFDDPLNFSAESYRDIFGMYSDDGGATWSKQNNLTNTAETQRENFFLYTSDKAIDGKVHAVWQEDSLVGHFNEGDIVHVNNIMYQAFDEEDFVAPTVTADFDYTVDLYYVTFNDLSTGTTCYNWDFGDGGTSTLASPAHLYAAGGTYTVCLTVSYPYGSVTTCKEVSLISAPAADFSFSGDPTVSFTDLSTNSPDSWSWDFNDGSTSTEQNPTHAFAENGLYNVCLTASNAGGSNTICKNVGINLATLAPEVDYTYTAVGLTVTFSDISTNSPTAWNWTFDDGLSSTEQNPEHIYSIAGDYNVCLQASNSGGVGSPACKLIQLVTGIFDAEQVQLLIYPNPAQDVLFLSSDKDLSTYSFKILNLAGQEMPSEMSRNQNTSVKFSINNLISGNYLLQVSDGINAQSFKISIQ